MSLKGWKQKNGESAASLSYSLRDPHLQTTKIKKWVSIYLHMHWLWNMSTVSIVSLGWVSSAAKKGWYHPSFQVLSWLWLHLHSMLRVSLHCRQGEKQDPMATRKHCPGSPRTGVEKKSHSCQWGAIQVGSSQLQSCWQNKCLSPQMGLLCYLEPMRVHSTNLPCNRKGACFIRIPI